MIRESRGVVCATGRHVESPKRTWKFLKRCIPSKKNAPARRLLDGLREQGLWCRTIKLEAWGEWVLMAGKPMSFQGPGDYLVVGSVNHLLNGSYELVPRVQL